MTGNKITHLPKDLSRCVRLQTLYAGANDITDPSPAFEPPHIIHAGLAHNKIAALPGPKVMSRAEALLSLDLTHNNLTSLPAALAALSQLPALRSLSLAGNPLALVPSYRATIAGVLSELQILDGKRIEGDHGAVDPNAPAKKAQDAPRPLVFTLRIAVTDISYAADPPPPPPPSALSVKVAGGSAGNGEAAGTDGDWGPAAALEDNAVFFVQYSLAKCGGENLATPIRTPRVRRTPSTETETESTTTKGEVAEGAAAVDSHETFLATLPLTAAARDVLSAGVEFELYRAVMIPAPLPAVLAAPATEGDSEGVDPTEADARGGGAEGQSAAAGAGDIEGAGEAKLVEQLTMVGSAVVRLGALLTGDMTEITAPVSFVPGPAMFGEALVGEVFLPLEGQPAQPIRGAATVTFTLHVPPPQVEEEGAPGD